MPDTSTHALLAAVLVLVVGVAAGGIAAIAFVDGGGGAAADDAGGDVADRGEQPTQAPILQQPSADTEYADLYDETIDSVVTVQVATQRGTGQGSGYLFDDEGHVVTNQHVVAEGETVRVRFSNDAWREATVVGTDRYTDLAVLHVEDVPDDAEPLQLAQSSPEEGQRVAALGSPFGLEGTITSGIVSGVNRSMRTRTGFTIPATVQTDAPINPGNSGGPLVSMNGTVLGVNRAKQGDNVGYAISAAVVRQVVPGLIENGTYDHPYVGIQSVPVTPDVAAANDLERAEGVHVVQVAEDGPADGVLRGATDTATVDGQPVQTGGDVILVVEGTQISSHQELSRVLMLQTRPGEQISLTILRDGERTTVELTLGDRPEETTGATVP